MPELLSSKHCGRLPMLRKSESQRSWLRQSFLRAVRHNRAVLDILTFSIPFQSSHRFTSGSSPPSKDPSAYSADYRAYAYSDPKTQNKIGVIHS